MKKIVIAIGGNSLIRDEKHQTVQDQLDATRGTCEQIAEIAQKKWRLAITHGNGPQVGFILLRSELASHVLHRVPMDSCGADTQGAIGYMLQQSLQNIFKARGIERRAVSIVTQVIVDPGDPAFRNPTKPIGPFYPDSSVGEKNGWQMMEAAGRGFRRVVASPRPLQIVEGAIIKKLVDEGEVVIGAGGGGVPVIIDNDKLRGVEAVIDKDYSSSLLARDIGADTLLISTSIDKVCLKFGKSQQRCIDTMNVRDAERYLQRGEFGEGSMKPKIEAGIDFLKGGGKRVIITSPEHMVDALEGEGGTRIE